MRSECVGLLGAVCVVGSNRKRPMLLYELLQGVELSAEATATIRSALGKANARHMSRRPAPEPRTDVLHVMTVCSDG
jgi:hypothetical protein